MDLTDEQWAILEPLIPEEERSPQGKRGRPWRDPREVLNGVFWILRTAAPWQDLPDRYPLYQTYHRRWKRRVRECVMEAILRTLAEDLRERGGLNVRECFTDGTFVVAKKGASGWERPSGAKVRRSWQWRWSSYRHMRHKC